jgi:hypothetical protein
MLFSLDDTNCQAVQKAIGLRAVESSEWSGGGSLQTLQIALVLVRRRFRYPNIGTLILWP